MSNELLRKLQGDRNPLHASPYSFWEIVSHLDETQRFDYFKTLLMKFNYLQILDDPHAEMDKELLIEDRAVQRRVPDGELIRPILGVLQGSDSLQSFYSAYTVRDSRGDSRQIRECAIRTRETLEEREGEYTRFVQKIIDALGHEELARIRDRAHHQLILDLIIGEVEKFKRRGVSGAGDPFTEKVISNTYIYYAYIFHRALSYLTRVGSKLDVNDYEDANICLHLRLDTPYCIITNDRGMRDALCQTIALLNEMKIETTLSVANVDAITGNLTPG